MIQARDTSFNIMYGRFIKPLELRVTKYAKNKKNFGKGNYDEVARRIMQHRNKWKYYTEIDHKTFDAHVTVDMLKLTHRFYIHCYPDHERELRLLANKTLTNKCRSRNNDKYVVKGTRMSGDVDTAFGNSLLNYGILKEALSMMNMRCDAIVNGDV